MDSISILGSLEPSSTKISFFLPTVPAGFPSPAQDHLEQRISLDNLLEIHTPQVFLAQAAGDSMQDVGIFDGDYLVVNRAREPRDGDVVIAAVEGEPLVKHFSRLQGQVVLYSANTRYAPRYILEGEELMIWGVVFASIRRLCSHA